MGGSYICSNLQLRERIVHAVITTFGTKSLAVDHFKSKVSAQFEGIQKSIKLPYSLIYLSFLNPSPSILQFSPSFSPNSPLNRRELPLSQIKDLTNWYQSSRSRINSRLFRGELGGKEGENWRIEGERERNRKRNQREIRKLAIQLIFDAFKLSRDPAFKVVHSQGSAPRVVTIARAMCSLSYKLLQL